MPNQPKSGPKVKEWPPVVSWLPGGPSEPKQWWRERARRARPATLVSLGAASATLTDFVLEQVPVGRTVVGYDALPGEIDVHPVLGAVEAADRQAGLVRVPTAGKRLSVHSLRAEREAHRFGFRQPVADAPELADLTIGAVLVPGLVFDRRGNRIGFGAGYYDRFLSRLRPGIPLVGMASLAPVERLPDDPHDINMTHLLFDGVVSRVQG